ncbi:hypothetical protein GCM10010211_83690 [Streptomyces albospinus]|uniref:Uncharacterized protein n=1 Tax=Streptomyces albospinus TaxID=285515 RepID=A0ABQ2VPY1_9ACTN|nr:hypothetical protein [Streptomyces albospinus]GGV03695.1 hypothetical protein GCM10010211_83690 [Streptomyces albospinus]
MGAESFSVDIEALKNAGLGAADLMALLESHSVGDIDCDADVVGHDGLGAALASFCERWQVGVKNLTKDGRGLSRNLIDTAGAYLEVDHQVAANLARIAPHPRGGAHG